ncbi:MAG: hypothetical protein C0596_17620 [Marinilabiliales bacterium]|nr:MAG: hypothetical protein C0596_17620 [Marinilabiliales bacterium]
MIFISAISCNNGKSTDKTQNNDTIPDKPEYNQDSASEDVAILMINPDGETEYVVGNTNNIYRKTKSGLEFKYIESGKTQTYPKVGDVVYFDMTYATANDSVVFDTKLIDPNFKMRITPPSHAGGCFEEALMMMSVGDSMAFKIDAKNFLQITQGKVFVPSYVKEGDKFIFRIKMKKLVDGSDYAIQNAETYKYYIDQENSLIERYALEIDYPRKTTKSGLNIFTISKGAGKKPVDGNLVTIDYTAGFIDGSVFDSTIERNKPFRFVVGKEEAIECLDEAVKAMNVGDHCLLIIPFRLAYGEEKNGVVAPFSTLVFEVELLSAE